MSAGQQASLTFGGPIVMLPALLEVFGSTQAGIILRNTGDIHRLINSSPTDIGDWIVPKTGMASYEAMLVPNTGTLSSGNVNVWEALSSDRIYTVTSAGLAKDFTGTLYIRRISTSIVLTSSVVHLNAQAI